MLLFTKRKLFQTNQYSQVSLVISAKKKNHIDFQVKENDINKDKWIGVGGHFEKGESPEECLLREVWEETGYTLTSWR